MPKAATTGTQPKDSQGGAPPIRPTQTVDPDGTSSMFTNPAGDKARRETFADWNLDPDLPAAEATPEPGELDRAVESGEARNPEGDTPPDKRSKPPTEAEERPEEAPGSSEGDGQVGEEPDTGVEAIIAKYKTMESLARGYKGIQQLQTAQAQKNQKEVQRIQAELAQKLELVEDFLERTDEGQWQVRPERAVEALQRGTPPPAMVDERAIREQAAAEVRAYLSKELQIEDDELDNAMSRSKTMIDRRSQEILQAKNQEIRRHYEKDMGRAYAMAEGFFAENPEFNTKPIRERVDRWYARFPAHVRPQLLLQGLLPVADLARLARMEIDMEPAIREAYELGKKHSSVHVEPVAGSPPSPGSRSPIQRGSQTDSDAELKAGILNAGRLESIFD